MEITRLIERCKQGDADALGELYKAYAQRMRGVCRRYISDEQTVDDVLHDAFVIIFTSFDRLRDAQKAESWMMMITRNVASKHKDHLNSHCLVPLEDAGALAAPNEEASVKGVPLEEVLKLIDKLPEGYGNVFRLSVFEGLSHKEIADMLGIEPHSSSSQLARAKKILRKMMKQYWAAVLLLLLMPLTFFLLKKDATVKDEAPVVEKQKTPLKEPSTEQPMEPVIVHLPVRHTTVSTDTLQPVVTHIKPDTLSNMMAQEHIAPDSIAADTTRTIRKLELPHDDIADIFPDKPIGSTNQEQRWSLQLAYAGQLDEQNHYNQPYTYQPVPSATQSLPGPSPTVPTSIDNWTDYALYLAYNSDAVSTQARSIIMNIALNNANRPGEDKILRTSHHRMPVVWSLALKYKLNNRFGLETGLNYSRLTSDFEMGTDGNVIREQQTIHYLGIPVKGIYNMYVGRQWSLYGSLGLTTEMPIHSPINTNYYLHGVLEATEKTTIRAPWQWSVGTGLGLQYNFTPNIGFFAEPSLQYYIPTGSNVETYRTEHPFSFSLPLGIRFTW
ncbi:MAG: sigma-70 family RNA polymerase sigma factor [Prevotella sp.]|nr:sigma-70 family RNA polymerase sigma factor [Prevotella sp.]